MMRPRLPGTPTHLRSERGERPTVWEGGASRESWEEPPPTTTTTTGHKGLRQTETSGLSGRRPCSGGREPVPLGTCHTAILRGVSASCLGSPLRQLAGLQTLASEGLPAGSGKAVVLTSDGGWQAGLGMLGQEERTSLPQTHVSQTSSTQAQAGLERRAVVRGLCKPLLTGLTARQPFPRKQVFKTSALCVTRSERDEDSFQDQLHGWQCAHAAWGKSPTHPCAHASLHAAFSPSTHSFPTHPSMKPPPSQPTLATQLWTLGQGPSRQGTDTHVAGRALSLKSF